VSSLQSRSLAALFALAAFSPLACSSTLEVTRINSAQEKPNNVWVFFTVEEEDEPIAGLTAEDFEIYEDDKLVSKFESKQTIQNPDVAAVMYTLLLLDMSGSITESGEADRLVDAAHMFSERVGKTQKVGVYAFDGGEDIYSVVRFTEEPGSIDGGLEGLRAYKSKDPSTNLNGAIVQGLEVLDKALEKDKRPLKFGTLVVFSDGSDRAARVSKEEMLEALGDEKYDDYEIYAIGVGAEIEQGELQEIGRDGSELAEDDEKVREAFEKVAARIEAHSKRFYLLSYCTPARQGEHRVRIDALANRDKKGKARSRGSLEYEFDANGFGPPPECDPERQPSFSLDKNLDGKAAREQDEKKKQQKDVNAGASVGRKQAADPEPPAGQLMRGAARAGRWLPRSAPSLAASRLRRARARGTARSRARREGLRAEHRPRAARTSTKRRRHGCRVHRRRPRPGSWLLRRTRGSVRVHVRDEVHSPRAPARPSRARGRHPGSVPWSPPR
jgi:hypothetical protein